MQACNPYVETHSQKHFRSQNVHIYSTCIESEAAHHSFNILILFSELSEDMVSVSIIGIKSVISFKSVGSGLLSNKCCEFLKKLSVSESFGLWNYG